MCPSNVPDCVPVPTDGNRSTASQLKLALANLLDHIIACTEDSSIGKCTLMWTIHLKDATPLGRQDRVDRVNKWTPTDGL